MAINGTIYPQPGQIIQITSSGPINQAILPLGGVGGGGGGWANTGAGVGNGGYGGGAYGPYLNQGGAGIAIASTGMIGGFGGYYAPYPVDPTLAQREAARYDGILQGYWWAILEGHEFPWLGTDVYAQAKALAALLRSPVAHTAVIMTERHKRGRDALDELCDDVTRGAFEEQLRQYESPYERDITNALQQDALRQAGLRGRQSLNTWGNANLGSGDSIQQQAPWYQRAFGGLFGGGTQV